jgi:hypothetical protein
VKSNKKWGILSQYLDIINGQQQGKGQDPADIGFK